MVQDEGPLGLDGVEVGFDDERAVAHAGVAVIARVERAGASGETIGLPATTVRTARTLRRRLLALPGRLTRTARRWTLRLPARSPWRHAFTEALTRILALPAAR